MKNLALVLMAAGMSRRFGGKPKQLAIVDHNKQTRLLDIFFQQAFVIKFSKIVFISNKKNHHLFYNIYGNKYKNISVEYIFQTYVPPRLNPWGTGDALACLYNKINIPFIFCNSDDLYGAESFKLCYRKMKETKNNVMIGFNLFDMMPKQGKVNRGIVNSLNNEVKSIIETCNIDLTNCTKYSKDTLCNANMFGFFPNILQFAKNKSDLFKIENKSEKKLEFFLTDLLNDMIKNNIKLNIYKSSEKWYGITNPGDEKNVKYCNNELSTIT